MRGNLGAPCRACKRLCQSEQGTLQLSFWAQLPPTWSHAGTSLLREGESGTPSLPWPRMQGCWEHPYQHLHPAKAGRCCVGRCVLNRGAASGELLRVPDGIVDLIYYSFDLLRNIQQQNVIQAPSQQCRQLLDVQPGGWPFPSSFLGWIRGFFWGRRSLALHPRALLMCQWLVGTTGGCRSRAWVLFS